MYVWGCGLERATNGDFKDVSPKQIPVPLPVLHLTASVVQNPGPDTPTQPTAVSAYEHKGPYTYHCPCFTSISAWTRDEATVGGGGDGNREALFTVTMTNSEVTPARWATRNIVCTLRPF